MKRRGNMNPIYRDVRQGTGGVAGGQFISNDGSERLVYNKLLLQENRLPLLQENGKFIYLETGSG